MTPQQQQQQQPLQSYQRATTNHHAQNDDPASNTINRQPPPPLPTSSYHLPRKLRCTTMVSVSHNSTVVHMWKVVATALGMIVLLVVFVVTIIMTSTSSNIQKIRPMLEMSHVASNIFPKVSSGIIVDGDDIDDHSITKRIVPNEHQRQQQYRVRMIRQQLLYIQEQIDGTIYFPPCTTDYTNQAQYDHNDENVVHDSQRYDTVATGWIKQRPISTETTTTTTTTPLLLTGSNSSSNDPLYRHPTEYSTSSAFDPQQSLQILQQHESDCYSCYIGTE